MLVLHTACLEQEREAVAAQAAKDERARIVTWLRDDVAKRATWFTDRHAALAVADLLDGDHDGC